MPISAERRMIRLYSALDASDDSLRVFRDNREELWKEIVGYHYSDNGSSDKRPANLLELAIATLRHNLVANCPQVYFCSGDRAFRAAGANWSVGINHFLDKQLHLDRILEDVVRDALTTWGIVMIGMHETGVVTVGDNQVEVGGPFVRLVDFDDWVHDANARVVEEMQYMASRFRVPAVDIYESDLWSGESKDRIREYFREGPDTDNEERVANLSGRKGLDEQQYIETAELWNVWLPLERRMIVVSREMQGEPLREIGWEDDMPDDGPYRTLDFFRPPQNTMPLSPGMLYLDIHTLANEIWLKLGRQAVDAKTVLGATPAATEDAETIRDASDQAIVRINHPDGVKEYRFNGPDNVLMGLGMHLPHMFSYYAGNIESMGGLTRMADTVGQETLISQSASTRIANMKRHMMAFVRDVVGDVSLYFMSDPLLNQSLTRKVPGTDISVPVRLMPVADPKTFLYNMEIHPYSMEDQTPSTKLAKLTAIWQTFLMPLLPIMQQQGVMLDVQGLLGVIRRLSNLDEIDDVLRIAGPMGEQDSGGVWQKPRQSPVTERKYTRTNVSGANVDASEKAILQMIGMGSQQSVA